MEIQAFTNWQAIRPHDAARPDTVADRPRPLVRPTDRPEVRPERPTEDIAERLRHLVRDTRQDVREVREDLGDLKARAKRLRALHQEAVETGDRKLHRLVTHLADHLKSDLREVRGEAQEVRDQVALVKKLIERFKAFHEGEEIATTDVDSSETDPAEAETIPTGELVDLSA